MAGPGVADKTSSATQITSSEVWRTRPNAPPPGTVLGPLDAIPEGRSKEYTFGPGIMAFRMFVVRKGDEVFGYLNICPHYSLPLNHRPDEFVTRDGTRIRCTQHRALFRIEDGACLDGACEGRALDPVPVTVQDGQLVLG